jgi:cell division protein FtsL
MSAYIHGNLAIEERQQQPKVKIRETKKTVYRKSAIPAQEKLLYLFTIAICVIVAGVIIFRYAQIYEVNTKIQQIEQQIEQLKVENTTLKIEVAKLQDPDRMLQKGIELGMISPADDQVVEVYNGRAVKLDKVAYAE